MGSVTYGPHSVDGRDACRCREIAVARTTYRAFHEFGVAQLAVGELCKREQFCAHG